MNFSQRVPSVEWVSLKHEGEEIAEVWFQPAGVRFTLVLRVLRSRVEVADVSQRVTLDKLLKAAAISTYEVESWRFGDAFHSEPSAPLPGYLTIYVHLKLPAQDTIRDDNREPEIPLEKWQVLEVVWKTILGLEANIDTSRLSVEGLRSEMEAAFKRPLNVEEKLNALQSDVAQLNGAKNRVHFALPKVREFIHRATWAVAVPERKRLEEIIKNHVQPRIPLPEMDKLREQMEHLQKDRQLLLAQGNAVSQECRGVLGEISRALSTLQRNAADNAKRKRDAKRQKGKY